MLPSFNEFYLTAVGLCMPMFLNWRTHRPIRSRLYLYPIWGSLGYLAGRALTAARTDFYVRKQVYVEEYVRLHPEDFPEEIAPKKYADVLLPWHPVR